MLLTYTLGKVSDAQDVLCTELLRKDLCACVLLLTYTLGKVSDAQDVLRTEPLQKELCACVLLLTYTLGKVSELRTFCGLSFCWRTSTHA